MLFNHFEIVFRSGLNYVLIVNVNETGFLLFTQIYKEILFSFFC